MILKSDLVLVILLFLTSACGYASPITEKQKCDTLPVSHTFHTMSFDASIVDVALKGEIFKDNEGHLWKATNLETFWKPYESQLRYKIRSNKSLNIKSIFEKKPIFHIQIDDFSLPIEPVSNENLKSIKEKQIKEMLEDQKLMKIKLPEVPE